MSYRVTKLFRTKDKTYNEKQVWIAIINNSYKILVYLNCNCKFEEGKEPNFYFSGSSVSLARNGCDCVENSGGFVYEGCNLCDILYATGEYLSQRMHNQCYACTHCKKRPRYGTHKYCGITCAKLSKGGQSNNNSDKSEDELVVDI
jgi:hypothetical protein